MSGAATLLQMERNASAKINVDAALPTSASGIKIVDFGAEANSSLRANKRRPLCLGRLL